MTTKDDVPQIHINIDTQYIPEQSQPDRGEFVYAYTISIHNVGSRAAKLLSRHWVITNANGDTEEVHGEGVVGVQPYLEPGEHFEYTSGVVLDTPVGTMHGSYQMVFPDDNKTFDIEIPPFRLAVQRMIH